MTAPARLDVFAPITKRERDPKTGHLYVYGKITGPDVDRDLQAMDPTWLKTAVPDWFTRGNIREQHDAKRAVGKAVELTEKADGWYIGAKIVDRAAAEKVEEEVLTGFSIGIKGPRLDYTKADAPNGVVTGGRICETSLVDVPCLGSAMISDHWEIPLAKADGAGDLQPVEEPELVRVDGDLQPVEDPQVVEKTDEPEAPTITPALAGSGVSERDLRDLIDQQLAKADLSAAGRRKAAATGAAMENGSYPITTKADLRKAIRAVGRGGADHDAIRKHIISRAKALGLEAMVPENWNADGSLKTDTAEKAEEILRTVRSLVPDLAKADDEDGAAEESEAADISGAAEAIAAIAKLIISEAESLAEGNLNEACDISLLLEAVRSLTWFKAREEQEDGGDGDMELADAAKADKTAAKNTTDEDEGDGEEDGKKAASKSEEPALTKADVADMVKTALAEAKAADEQRIEALAADLAKAHSELDAIKALPQAGGPVLTRTQTQATQARKTDADLLRAEARLYLAKADVVEDRYLRDGYKEKAQQLLAKADA